MSKQAACPILKLSLSRIVRVCSSEKNPDFCIWLIETFTNHFNIIIKQTKARLMKFLKVLLRLFKKNIENQLSLGGLGI